MLPKHACQELDDLINRVFLLLMLLPRQEGVLPEYLVRALELAQLHADGCLVSFDGSDALDDRVDVEELGVVEGGETGGTAACSIEDRVRGPGAIRNVYTCTCGAHPHDGVSIPISD
jgi:hypothetical protein